MPVGLDGDPDPVVTPVRTAVLEAVADRADRVERPRTLVGIDGRSGAGKSTFGDELARALERRGRSVVRSTTDLFHRPRVERMQRGATSPEGYYRDSHQISTMLDELIVPFADGADEVLVGAFDEPSDSVRRLTTVVPHRAVLVFDGLFVHRPELRQRWHLSVMLHADRRCDEGWLRYLEADLPRDPTDRAAEVDRRLQRARWPRYRHGWARYLDVVGRGAADMDIDNEDLSAPAIIDDAENHGP